MKGWELGLSSPNRGLRDGIAGFNYIKGRHTEDETKVSPELHSIRRRANGYWRGEGKEELEQGL